MLLNNKSNLVSDKQVHQLINLLPDTKYLLNIERINIFDNKEDLRQHINNNKYDPVLKETLVNYVENFYGGFFYTISSELYFFISVQFEVSVDTDEVSADQIHDDFNKLFFCIMLIHESRHSYQRSISMIDEYKIIEENPIEYNKYYKANYKIMDIEIDAYEFTNKFVLDNFQKIKDIFSITTKDEIIMPIYETGMLGNIM